jgi:hypothetical protein
MGYRRSDEGFGAFLFVLFFIFVIFIVIFSARGCTDASGATRVLTQQGYTNIEITGHRWWGASQGDTYVTGFKAISPNGHPVTGYVTSGWLKGSTIRFD